MSDFDLRLREDLTAEDRAFLKDLEDGRGLFDQLGATFQGPLKYWTALVFIFIFGWMALGVFFAFQVAATDDPKATMLWMFGITGCVFAIAMLKMWLFQRVNHLATLRELKKIELRLAQLERGGA